MVKFHGFNYTVARFHYISKICRYFIDLFKIWFIYSSINDLWKEIKSHSTCFQYWTNGLVVYTLGYSKTGTLIRLLLSCGDLILQGTGQILRNCSSFACANSHLTFCRHFELPCRVLIDDTTGATSGSGTAYTSWVRTNIANLILYWIL